MGDKRTGTLSMGMIMEYLYELIMRVSDFPEIYLGRPSLERLYAFIGGYLEAKPEADDHCLDGFNEYVSERYRINSDHNWSGIITFFSTSEKQAFESFKTLFAEFREEQRKRTGDSPLS